MIGPTAAAVPPSMTAVQQTIVAEMRAFEAPLQKYEYLVGVARATPAPTVPIREPEFAVPGCQSQVWIRAELHDGRMRLFGDSDALITRGIVTLLLRVLDGRTPAEILDGELFFLERTGLGAHLSPARSNGLAAMIQHIRQQAQAARGASDGDGRAGP